MAEKIPLKLVDAGSGAGELREFAATDTIPHANLPEQTSSTDITAGALLKVGAFGLGATGLAVTGNLDDITITGIYYTSTADASSPAPGNALTLQHMAIGTSAAVQFATRQSADISWFRRKSSGVWSAWFAIWHSGNLVKTISAIDTTTGSILKVGDFGVGITLSNVEQNLNNLSTTGFVCVGGTEADAVANNWPTTGLAAGTAVFYTVETITNSSNSRTSQVATECYTTIPGVRQWIRTKHDAVWTAWVEVWTNTGANAITVATGSLGYGTGSGGTVTQATSKSTAVTLNKPSGRITTVADSLAAGAQASFLLNNSMIAAGDVVLVSTVSATGASLYEVAAWGVAAGFCYIRVKNIDAAAQAHAVAINFIVIKGAIA